MNQGQINDTLEQIFTTDELGQIVIALKDSYFAAKDGDLEKDLEHIETALQKIGWVMDESQPEHMRPLRDYEL